MSRRSPTSSRAPGAQPPRAPRLGGYGGLDALVPGAAPSARADQAPLSKAADAAAGVATEALHGQLSQLTKRHLLCGCSGFQRGGRRVPGAQRAGRARVAQAPSPRVGESESATLLRISARPVEARASVPARSRGAPFVLALVPGKMHDEVAGLVRRARRNLGARARREARPHQVRVERALGHDFDVGPRARRRRHRPTRAAPSSATGPPTCATPPCPSDNAAPVVRTRRVASWRTRARAAPGPACRWHFGAIFRSSSWENDEFRTKKAPVL